MLRMLGELQLELIDGKGTAIGNGLGVALTRLRRSDAKSKVIILLTDGDNNAGNITPMKAAGIAQQLGVKIYTVLAGDNASADDAAARRRFPVNPKLLEEIATRTGGVPYLATDTQALSRAVPGHPGRAGEVPHPRAGRAVRRAVPALPVSGAAGAAAGDRPAPHPLSPVALTMRFAQPFLLWLLLLVPLVVLALVVSFTRRRRLLERLGGRVLVERMAASVSVPRKVLRAGLVVLALALLLLALARPQAGGRAKLERQRGLDLVVALDFSKSMLARDMYPSRLERAKRELERLMDRLAGDRVGLVAFAGEVMTYPPTTDYAAVKLFWRDLTPGGHAGGRDGHRPGAAGGAGPADPAAAEGAARRAAR